MLTLRCSQKTIALLMGLCTLAGGCTRDTATSQNKKSTKEFSMQLTSPQFEDGQPLPKLHAYKGEGHNVAPTLQWSDAPEGTKSFALIVDDPDAPRDDPWVHWVAYNIPGGAAGLPTDSITQGVNDFDEKGYGGPLPPEGHGVHHYHFKLYALDADFDLRPGLSKDQLLGKIDGHILTTAKIVGTYER